MITGSVTDCISDTHGRRWVDVGVRRLTNLKLASKKADERKDNIPVKILAPQNPELMTTVGSGKID